MFGRNLKNAGLILRCFILASVFPSLAFADTHACHMIDPNNEPAKSIAACSEYLEADQLDAPLQASALMLRGIALREIMEFERSVLDLNASLALISDTSTMRMLAWTYREMERYSEAEKLYTRILEEDSHWQGWLSRCVVRQDLGNFSQALPDCMEALKQDEGNLDILYFTARAYSFLERPKEALPLLDKAIVLSPDEPRYLVERAWVLYQLGHRKLARAFAHDALDRFKDEPGLLFFLQETR